MIRWATCYLSPFRRLKMLQIKLVQGLPHNAGLNPKAFRLYTLLGFYASLLVLIDTALSMH